MCGPLLKLTSEQRGHDTTRGGKMAYECVLRGWACCAALWAFWSVCGKAGVRGSCSVQIPTHEHVASQVVPTSASLGVLCCAGRAQQG